MIVFVCVCSLFSKLALLLRQRITAFGHDVQISVRCLQTLVQAIDARYENSRYKQLQLRRNIHMF